MISQRLVWNELAVSFHETKRSNSRLLIATQTVHKITFNKNCKQVELPFICYSPTQQRRQYLASHAQLKTYLASHAQLKTLVFARQATDNRHSPYAELLSELDRFFFDLLGQFAGWRQDDCVRAFVGVFQPGTGHAKNVTAAREDKGVLKQ